MQAVHASRGTVSSVWKKLTGECGLFLFIIYIGFAAFWLSISQNRHAWDMSTVINMVAEAKLIFIPSPRLLQMCLNNASMK